VNQEFSQN